MDDILLFAEHPPTQPQTGQILARISDLRGRGICVLLHHHHARSFDLMDEIAGARGLPARSMVDEMRNERAWHMVEAQQALSHLLGVLRRDGHRARGELVGGPLTKTVLREVRDRRPEIVALLLSRHRLAHAAHRDLVHRLRHRYETELRLLNGAPERRPG